VTAPVAPVVEPTAPNVPAGDVTSRPSVGAVMRRQSGEAAPEPVPPKPAAPVEVVAAPEANTAKAPSAPIDRDTLTQAWGDVILGNLPARVKAVYSAGRFVAVDGDGAQFALPNAAHRDHCVDLVPQVEAAIAQHFGTPVRLILVVDGGPSAPRPAPTRPTGPTRGGDDGIEEVEEVDLEKLRSVTATDTDQASAAEARLMEAFPGASEEV
jgi:DNA polymerase III subunit gamma/tau